MKDRMKRNIRLWLILAILVVTALLATFWATTYIPVTRPFEPKWPPSPFEPRWPPGDGIRGDIELFYTIKTVVSTINATLLIFLLITYINIYTRTKSEFTVGLIIFSMVLLLYALTTNPLVHWIFGFRAVGLGPFAMLPDVFTCVALAILLYLTLRY